MPEWAGCIAGALTTTDLEDQLIADGLEEVDCYRSWLALTAGKASIFGGEQGRIGPLNRNRRC